MKYTKSEFAAHIRNQYPKDYDDLTDEKLVELWLKKYPDDKAKLINQSSSYRLSNFLWNVLVLILIWMGLTIIDLDFQKIPFISNINKHLISTYKSRGDIKNGFNRDQINANSLIIDTLISDTSLANNEGNYEHKEQVIEELPDTNKNRPIRTEEINNSLNNLSSGSEKGWINILEGGVNLMSELSKSHQFERRVLPLTCTECKKTIEVDGYYKESTDEFKPIEELPTKWFHTHKWKLLR